jgi:hypothetical protein
VIEVDVTFNDDPGPQRVVFAVMPRVGEKMLVCFDEEIVPTAWVVTAVLHTIHQQSEPTVSIKVESA